MPKLIEAAFKNKAVIAYFTYGDPSIGFTKSVVETAFNNGADIVELGIPFSDPIADGPVIQKSHQRALSKNDCTIKDALITVKAIKEKIEKPLVFMAAVNLIYQYGVASFFKHAKAHKLDGIIIPDLSIESADSYIVEAKKNDIALIFLVSPLCKPTRLKKIVKKSTGFVYLISSTGLTGERQAFSKRLITLCKDIRAVKNIPVAVGFGISTSSHVKEVLSYADGAIIGSHLVKSFEKKKQSEILSDLTIKLKKLKK
jgi:tryptophan synthase alpha chain